jgi:hypothetical protein
VVRRCRSGSAGRTAGGRARSGRELIGIEASRPRSDSGHPILIQGDGGAVGPFTCVDCCGRVRPAPRRRGGGTVPRLVSATVSASMLCAVSSERMASGCGRCAAAARGLVRRRCVRLLVAWV